MQLVANSNVSIDKLYNSLKILIRAVHVNNVLTLFCNLQKILLLNLIMENTLLLHRGLISS